MGLKCSHGAFDGAYGAFHRFRQVVCQSIGGSYPPHYFRYLNGNFAKDENNNLIESNEWSDEEIYFPDFFTQESTPGIWEFFVHSDHDGFIDYKLCKKIADELTKHALPNIEKYENSSYGHIEGLGGYKQVLIDFICGCNMAYDNKENLSFN